ncbi:MAG: TrkA family potassium uptake protein [Halobacteriales archaeon]
MTFLIVGGGRVGLRTARTLERQGYDVVIVEQDPEKINRIEDEGFRYVKGDGAREDVLKEAGIETAEAVAGLTGDLNVNFAACTLGKEFGCRTVLRIDEDYREDIYEEYASEVDEVIYPERLGAVGAKTALLGGDFNVIADLTEELELITLNLPDDAPVIGKRVNEIELAEARIYAHGRKRMPMTIPLPGTELKAGDQIAVICEHDVLEDVKRAVLGDENAEGDQ